MTESDLSHLRVLGIFAHPDDAEYICGGSAAFWADRGARITYVIVTTGAAGSNDPGADLAQLVRTREAEQRAACAVLGVEDVLFLGYPDGTLEATLDLRHALTRVIRQVRPDRVICGDPSVYFAGDTYINHPDHRAAAEAGLYAVFPSAPTRPVFPELLAEGLEPHQVKELYLWSGDRGANTYVDITTTIERKVQALLCHQSQVDAAEGDRVRSWALEAGKAANLPYAEAFRVMKLVDETGS